MNQALDDLLAKQAITEALADYCRAMDRIDDALGRSVFHPDATADYGAMFDGTGHGFIDFVHVAHSGMVGQHHQIGNVRIEIEGDQASSETYVTATLRLKNGEGLLEIRSLGRYLDRWEKRAGRWAIMQRHYVHGMDETRQVQPSAHPDGGRRDREDPSYAHLKPPTDSS